MEIIVPELNETLEVKVGRDTCIKTIKHAMTHILSSANEVILIEADEMELLDVNMTVSEYGLSDTSRLLCITNP